MNWIWNSYRLLVQPMKQFYWSYLLRYSVLFFCCILIEWGSIFLSSFYSSFCQKRKSYFKKQLADSNSIIPSIPPLLAITSNRYTTLFMILFSMGSLLTFIINIWLLPLFIRGYFSVSTSLSIEQHIHLMHCL